MNFIKLYVLRRFLMAYLQNFTHDTARVILQDIIKTLNAAENAKKIAEAKSASSGSGMTGMVQFVFPLVMQVQMEAIKKYGFPGNREGLVQFSQLVRDMENEVEDIAKLRAQIRALYLPPMVINTTNDILV